MSLDEVLAARRGERALPEKAVLLTYDDGYRTFYSRVHPLLRLYGYPAVLALVGRWMETPPTERVPYGDSELPRSDFLAWDEEREMIRSGLVEVASHSYDLHRGNTRQSARKPAACGNHARLRQINDKGALVKKCWCELPKHYPHISLDAFVTMPNHIHGIIFIVGAGLKPAPTHPLHEVVRAFKTFSSRAINSLRVTPGQGVWQRGYYEHVIRNDDSLNRIREYITTNPMRWDLDRENIKAQGKDDFDRWLESLSDRAKIAPGKIV